MVRSRLLTLSLALALAIVPSLASAATFSSISWAVTGGTFSGQLNLASGPVTSGTVVYTPPGGSFSTPTLALTGGSLFVSLNGPPSAELNFREVVAMFTKMKDRRPGVK